MSNFTFNVILTVSVIIPSLIGLFRYKEVIKSYHPILILFLVALVNETLSIYLSTKIYSTSYNNNIYIFIELMLFLWQFYRWGFPRKRRTTHILIISIFSALVWILDNLVLNSIADINPLFRVYYSFVLIYLSIDQINSLIVNERGKLFQNSRFLFCAGILLFYSYKSLIESFYLFHIGFSNQFYHYLFLILAFVNVFVNFLYGVAVLCIPTREKFTMRF
jgi:hypothetical protein